MTSAKRHEAQSPAGPGGVTVMDDPISAQIIHEVVEGMTAAQRATVSRLQSDRRKFSKSCF
jgi:hypothetical protein